VSLMFLSAEGVRQTEAGRGQGAMFVVVGRGPWVWKEGLGLQRGGELAICWRVRGTGLVRWESGGRGEMVREGLRRGTGDGAPRGAGWAGRRGQPEGGKLAGVGRPQASGGGGKRPGA